jgi:hypothetical protein
MANVVEMKRVCGSHPGGPGIPEDDRPCMSVDHILLQAGNGKGPMNDSARLVPDSGEIECLRAQELVLPFATTEEKAEALSKKLKSGCVKNKNGGCKVKASVLWEALEDGLSETQYETGTV